MAGEQQMPPKDMDTTDMGEGPRPMEGADSLGMAGGQKPMRGPGMGPDSQPENILRIDDIFSLLIVLLIIGMNIGVKLYFKAEEAAKKMEEQEKESLEHQLAYLKYQLNPHFFMNTLNNIHALVDIDPEKAKDTIIDLSKLMRYVLYESDRKLVPAEKEHEFMDNYVRLMRIRYPESKLRFEVENPDDLSGIYLPPLMVISFVENAFKHGVGGSKQSYIKVRSQVMTDEKGRERMVWTCKNSKPNMNQDSKNKLDGEGGVGLVNTKRRLDLIYGDDYTLLVDDGEEEFTVTMNIPIKREI